MDPPFAVPATPTRSGRRAPAAVPIVDSPTPALMRASPPASSAAHLFSLRRSLAAQQIPGACKPPAGTPGAMPALSASASVSPGSSSTGFSNPGSLSLISEARASASNRSDAGTDAAHVIHTPDSGSIECAYQVSYSSSRDSHLQFMSEYFESNPRLMGLYLSSFLAEVMVIESHQQRFREEFLDYLGRKRVDFRWEKRRDVEHLRASDRQTGRLAEVREFRAWIERVGPVTAKECAREGSMPPAQDMPGPRVGLMVMRFSDAIDFASEFFTRVRCDLTEKYDVLVDMPRSVIAPFFDPQLSRVLHRFVHVAADRMLAFKSPDRDGWWEYSNAPENQERCFGLHRVLYPYQHVEAFAADLDALTVELGDLQVSGDRSTGFSDALRVFEERQRLQGEKYRAGIDTVQLTLACHMYVQYALVNRTIAANKIKPTDDVSMLADILFAMVTDDRDQLDPVENRAICHLYERPTQRSPDAVGGGPDTTGVLDTLARMARDVRKWIVDDLSPSQRLHQNRDEVSRGMLVSALYRRASSIVSGSVLLSEVCRMSLASVHRTRLRRQVTVASTRVAFTEFLHQLENQVHLVRERAAFRAWVRHAAPWARYDDLLWASSLTRESPTPPAPDAPLHLRGAYTLEMHCRALKLLEHIQYCDHSITVLRLGSIVSIEEVRMSLDYYCAVFPSCMTGLFQKFLHVGLDGQGVFVAATREHSALLTQTMLLSACTSPGFRHNVPLFPALVRLFFCTYDGTRPDPPRPITDDESLEHSAPILHPNHHALYCVANILAHWLGLPTASPSDMVVPLDSDTRIYASSESNDHVYRQTRQRLEFTTETRENLSSGPLKLAACYVPDPHHPSFLGLQMLHSFALRLETALGRPLDTVRDVPDELAEALAGHLELLRPRRVRRYLAEPLLDRLVASRRAEYGELISAIQEYIDSLPERDASATAPGRVPLGSKRQAPRDAPVSEHGDSGVVLDAPRLIYALYVASDMNHLGPQLTRALFLEGGLEALGRPRVTAAGLRFSNPIANETAEDQQYTRDITGGYTHMFSIRNAGSTRSVKDVVSTRMEYDMPVDALGHLIRLVEAGVAPVALAEALGARNREGGLGGAPPPGRLGQAPDGFSRRHPSSPGLMDNETSASLVARFDFTGFIGARRSGARPNLGDVDPHAVPIEDQRRGNQLEIAAKLRAVRARLAPLVPQDAIPTVDAHSYTPVQVWPTSEAMPTTSASGSPNVGTPHVCYMESFFSIVTFKGGTHANHLREWGVDPASMDAPDADAGAGRPPPSEPEVKPRKGARAQVLTSRAVVAAGSIEEAAATEARAVAPPPTPPGAAEKKRLVKEENGEPPSTRDSALDRDEESMFDSAEDAYSSTVRQRRAVRDLQAASALERADRVEFIRILNHAWRMADFAGDKSMDPNHDPADSLKWVLEAISALEVRNEQLKRRDGQRGCVSTGSSLVEIAGSVLPESSTNGPGQTRFDQRLFPFRFATREDMGKFVCGVVRGPVPGESEAQRMERLNAHLRMSRGRHLLDFIVRLYHLCGSSLFDPRLERRPENSAYEELIETGIPTKRDEWNYHALVREAMRRGLLYKLARDAREQGPVDMTDIDEFFEEITRK